MMAKSLVWHHALSDRIRISYQNPCGCCPNAVDIEEVPWRKVRPKRVSLLFGESAEDLYRLWEVVGWRLIGEL